MLSLFKIFTEDVRSESDTSSFKEKRDLKHKIAGKEG